jgi:hypothetical protein
VRTFFAWLTALGGLYAGVWLFAWCINNLQQTAGTVIAAAYGAVGVAFLGLLAAAAICERKLK